MLTYQGLRFTFPNQEDWVLGKILEMRADTHANRPFLQFEEEPSLTYTEVNGIVNRIAHSLANLGVGKGDRVMIMLPNSLEYIYTWFALCKLGAIEVPVNNAYKGYFLEHVANNSGSSLLVLDEEFLDRIAFSEERMPQMQCLVVYHRNGTNPKSWPRFSRLAVSEFKDLLTGPEDNPGTDVKYWDIGAIMYTSGTTGASKGVLMPHAHLYVFAEEDINLLRLTDNDVYYTCNPFFHGNGQALTIYPALIAGAKVVVYETFSASRWLEQIRKSGATVTNYLGVMMDFVYKQPPTPRDRDHHLRAIFAVPTPAGIVHQFKERFGVEQVLDGYGMTEIGMVTLTPFGEMRENSCGLAVSDLYELDVVDPETDAEVPPGELGELVVRPKIPWAFNVGYYGMPDKTVEAYRNCWFHTGDGLRRDEEGWFYFVDRIKDALRRRGENISSYEVEKVINDHLAVLESAVIAVKAEYAGGEDEVKACVVLKEGNQLTPVELLQWCEQRMPYFAVPRYIEFLTDLPKTPNQKVQKHLLRQDGLNKQTFDREAAGFKLEEEIKREAKKKARQMGG